MVYDTLLVLCCVLATTTTHAILDDVMSDVSRMEAQLTSLEHHEHRHQVELSLLEERAIIQEVGICPGDPTAYRCKMNGAGVLDTCLPGYLVCDGVPDCPHGDDEICDDLMTYMQPGTVYDSSVVYDRGCSTVTFWKTFVITVLDMYRDPITNKITVSFRQEMGSDDTTFVIWYQMRWEEMTRAGHTDYYPTYWLTSVDPADPSTAHSKAYRALTDQMCAHYVWKRR